MFTQARLCRPCVIFIDEIDAVGYSRGDQQAFAGGHREMEMTLNQLLNEMDGFEKNHEIVVIGATNLEAKLDSALTRTGRFDYKIKVDYPSKVEVKQILLHNLKNKQHSITDATLDEVTNYCMKFSGATLQGLVNQVFLLKARESVNSPDS